jgi:hypothetical protein
MSRINSFTDTIGLRSPHSWGTGIVGGAVVADVPDGGGAGFDEEHANRTLITISSPTQTATGERRH